MKERIIEIVELGQPKSLIQRGNAPITELIKTDVLIEELNEQLRLYNVVGRSEQLVICKKCGSSEMYQYTKTKDKCEECGNIQDY